MRKFSANAFFNQQVSKKVVLHEKNKIKCWLGYREVQPIFGRWISLAEMVCECEVYARSDQRRNVLCPVGGRDQSQDFQLKTFVLIIRLHHISAVHMMMSFNRDLHPLVQSEQTFRWYHGIFGLLVLFLVLLLLLFF